MNVVPAAGSSLRPRPARRRLRRHARRRARPAHDEDDGQVAETEKAEESPTHHRARRPAPESADRQQDAEGDHEQDDRDRGGTDRIAALDASEDKRLPPLGLRTAGCPRSARRRQPPPPGERAIPRRTPAAGLEDDPPEHRDRPGAERGRGLLHLTIEPVAARAAPCGSRTESVTNRSASTIAVRVYATSTPIGPCGPYSARSVSPATIVGSANGRSMSVLTKPCPWKRSRTRIHATIVPITALMSTTTADATRVSFSAATDCGSVTASQNPVRPSCAEYQIRAASGSRTITLRYAVARPMPRAAPGLPPSAWEESRPGRPKS